MRIGIIITVRTGSSRLPKKCLSIIAGKEVIRNLISRCKQSKYSECIVIATTTEKGDDVLEKIAGEEGVSCYRGSIKDIIARHHGAVSKFEFDAYLAVDGDDVLCDPVFMDLTGDELKNGKWDAVIWKGYPFGATPIGISAKALDNVFKNKKKEDTETGWGRFFTGNNFKIKSFEAKNKDASMEHPEIRLSLDYEEDLNLILNIVSYFTSKGITYEAISMVDIVRYLISNPNVNAINDPRKEEYWQNFNKKAVDVSLKGAKK